MKIEIALDSARGPILIKRASEPGDAELLEAESLALTAARHQGVAQMIKLDTDITPPELSMTWIGPHSLATVAPPEPVEVANLVASLADTVADLHARGLTHTRITAEHVVIDGDGKPVLCGLRAAGSIQRTNPASDVADLGRLLAQLLGESSDGFDLEPIPDHRSLRRPQRWTGFNRRNLLLLADQASADDPRSRPTARAFADLLRTAVGSTDKGTTRRPTARSKAAATVLPRLTRTLPDAIGINQAPKVQPITSDRSRPSLKSLRSPARVAVGLAAVIALGLGIAELMHGSARASADTASAAIPDDAPSTTAAPTTATLPPATTSAQSPKSPATSLAGGCGLVTLRSPDIDGDGCSDDVEIARGSIRVAEARYAIGEPEDPLAIAPWGCADEATAAYLRVSTGEVFVFDDWATIKTAVSATAAAVVSEAASLEPVDSDGDGCLELLVRRRDGTTSVLPIGGKP